MSDFNRILKECYWDSEISEDDIRMILKGTDTRLRMMFFSKLMQNSTKLLLDLQLFPRDQLKEMLDNYVIPHFNHEYNYRRKNIAEAFFFNKTLEIDELKWPA